MRPRLRPARPAECAALSALALRAKAGWGYDAAFMAACAEELRVTPARLRQDQVQVAVRGAEILGMATLARKPGATSLELMFIEPAAQGQGIGRHLFAWAVATARRGGARTLEIEADPGAEGFYLRMGATRRGLVPSTAIAGRRIPRLVFDLSQAPSR